MLVVDLRERVLAEMLAKDGVEHETRIMDVGDVLFESPRGAWIAERKRADDLASSIKSGRWHEQQYRLFASGKPVVFIIEGDIRGTSLPHSTLMSAVLNASQRAGAHMFRTWDISETAKMLPQLSEKINAPHAVPTGVVAPPLLSKRKREADKALCTVRMLMCIPSVSEGVARKLLEHFGSLAALQRAIASDELPKVSLEGGRRLGKARITRLKSVLVDNDDDGAAPTEKEDE